MIERRSTILKQSNEEKVRIDGKKEHGKAKISKVVKLVKLQRRREKKNT